MIQLNLNQKNIKFLKLHSNNFQLFSYGEFVWTINYAIIICNTNLNKFSNLLNQKLAFLVFFFGSYLKSFHDIII